MKASNAIKLAAVLLCFAAASADAAPRTGKPSLAPTITSPEAADKTVVIKDTTKFVNVYEDETILFVVGANKFPLNSMGTAITTTWRRSRRLDR